MYMSYGTILHRYCQLKKRLAERYKYNVTSWNIILRDTFLEGDTHYMTNDSSAIIRAP